MSQSSATDRVAFGDFDRNNSSPREVIFRVAIEEFAAKGFSGARVQAIADTARLNKQLIYHYFGNKQSLYEAVLEQMLTAALPPEGIKTLDDIAGALDNEYAPTLSRMLGWEGLESSGQEITSFEQRKSAFDLVTRWVKAQQTAKAIDPTSDPTIVAYLIVLGLLAPAILPQLAIIMTGMDPSTKAFKDSMKHVLRNSFRPAP
jgi:TetR/AcrR family transcriptional regulator